MAEVSKEAEQAQNVVSMDILESSTSGSGRHTYLLRALSAGGEPLEGVDLTIKLMGDGSLAAGFSSPQIHRETDKSGAGHFTWYRRSIYGRDVKARLTVTADKPEAQVSIEEIEPERANTSYDFIGAHKWRL